MTVDTLERLGSAGGEIPAATFRLATVTIGLPIREFLASHGPAPVGSTYYGYTVPPLFSAEECYLLRTIAQQEAEQLTHEHAPILRAAMAHSLVFILRQNAGAYWRTLSQLREQVLTTPAAMIRRRSIYRLVLPAMNLIGSMQMFLEATRKTIIRTYGRESDVFHEFSHSLERSSSSSLAFRLVEVLRNYALHQGIPISSIEVYNSGTPHAEVDAVCQRSYFLEDRQCRRELREDVRGLPETFRLSPLLYDALQRFESIHEDVLCAEAEVLRRSLRGLDGFVDGLPGNVQPVIATIRSAVFSDNTWGYKLSVRSVPIDEAAIVSSELAAVSQRKWRRSPHRNYSDGWTRVFG